MRHSPETKFQVLQDAKKMRNLKAASRKHGVPYQTAFTWSKREKQGETQNCPGEEEKHRRSDLSRRILDIVLNENGIKLSVADKRRLTDKLSHEGFTVVECCDELGISRSSYYGRPEEKIAPIPREKDAVPRSDAPEKGEEVARQLANSSSQPSESKPAAVKRKKTGAKRGRKIPGFSCNTEGKKILDSDIIGILKKYRARIEFCNALGYRKLTEMLRRHHNLIINPKKVYRLCRIADILLEQCSKKRKKRIPGNPCARRMVTGPRQVWEFDITYYKFTGQERFFFTVAFIDVFTRKVVGMHTGLCCKAANLCAVLETALQSEGITRPDCLVVRSDNGSQMTSWKFFNFLKRLEYKIEHERIPVQSPNKNAHVESWFSVLKRECLDVRYIPDMKTAYEILVSYIKCYNEERPHGSLLFNTPSYVDAVYRQGSTLDIKAVSI